MGTKFNNAVWLFTLLALVGCSQSSAPDEKKPAGPPAAASASGPAAAAPGAASAPAASTAAVEHADLRFAPKEAFAAFVVFPRRVLISGEMGKLDLSGPLAAMEKRLGFSPLDTVQIVSFAIAAPGDGPQAASNFGGGVEVVLSKPLDPGDLVKGFLEGPTESANVAGKRYVRPKAQPNRAGAPPMCFALIDDFTFLLAPEREIKLMLTAAGAKTPLTSLLDKLDPHADLAVVATNPEDLRKIVAAQIKSGEVPPPLAPYTAAPDLINSTTLSVNTMPEISIHWSIESRDEAGAKKLAEMLTGAGQMAQQMLPGLQQAAAGAPPEMKAGVDYGLGLAAKLAAGLTPKQIGNQVTLDIQGLGTVDDLATKLVGPAVDAARLTAERAARLNNLKQLAISMLSLADTNGGKFSAAAIYSKDGKPLLSWRVAVLPYIEQENLYKKFHLDEPWDSPNNKPLIAEMPKTFLAAGEQNPEGGRTRFLVPTGKGTMFEGQEGIKLGGGIPDGASNTLLIVEAGHDKAVIWTKPEDISVDPDRPAAALGDIGSDGFAAAFADGAARVLKKTIDSETLRRLLLRNDGQPVDPSKL